MEFTSITEYFYKIYSRTTLIILLPAVAFVFTYLQPAQSRDDRAQHFTTLLITATLLIFAWAVVFIFFNKKIKTVRKRQGLREKLEKYFLITTVRYSVFSACSLLLALMFYLTRVDLFVLAFLVQIVVCVFVWPTPAKVSGDLRLKGDEREMVYYKKDVL